MTDISFPDMRGKLTQNRPLADLTWLRVGGPADYFYQPADADDLAAFMKALPADVVVMPMGVGSNVIVRAGAAELDAHVARKAADAGLDLTFLRTIPGSIGGAVRMNAGCYGAYTADYFISADAITRTGEQVTLGPDDLQFAYRQTALPDGYVITAARFAPPKGEAQTLHARMEDQLRKRDETQPTKDRSAGSTFRNPAGFSSTGQADDRHDLKAWKVIDDAGLRGATLGGAQMSPKHPNFLINTGSATAADLEALGEMVRKKVYDSSGITLEWEIMRIGEK